MRHAKELPHLDNGQFLGGAVIGQLHSSECALGARACQAHFCTSRRGPEGSAVYPAWMSEKADPSPYQAHLQAWREFRGFTQEEAGDRLKVAHTTLGRWERGISPLTTRSLLALCHLYEVSPQQLLSAPAEAPIVARTVEMQSLIADLDDEAFEHLRFFARRISGTV